MKKSNILFFLLCIATVVARAQVQQLDGVYVGAQLYSTPFDGMQINNTVIYFRNDGTFTDKLNTDGWKTHVSGKYTIKNGAVHLTFNNGDESKVYKLAANGALQSTVGIAYTLHKVKKTATIPAAGYERKTASSAGGMGTGMPNVAAFSSNHLYFDGKGHFSLDHAGTVGIGGDVNGGTIGGKSEHQDKTKQGTYTLNDGEIVLRFDNGTIAKHSFFYSPPNEEDLIVVDGEFYFREEKEPSAAEQGTIKAKENIPSKESAALPSTADLLNKLRGYYGGENIDKITTMRETSTLTGNLQAVVLTDVAGNKIRVEVRQQGQLLLVKQLTGNEGWQWVNGTKKPLSQAEKDEMLLSLYQGLLGLHKKMNRYFLTGTVSRSKDDYMLTFSVQGHKLVYLVGKDYTLKANAYSINDVPNYSAYRDFIKSKGITYPTITESSDGKNTIIATTTNIEFNPVLTDVNWKTPE